MAKEGKLILEKREPAGSAAAQRLRHEGWVPGVVYSGIKSESIRLKCHEFEQMLRHHSSENLILDAEIDGGVGKKVLLKEVQHDPVTGNILHVDMVEISMTEKMRIPIPIKLVGEPVGVSQDGGILDHLLRALEVECLPVDLVEFIEADVSGLSVNSSIQVSDLQIDSKLTVVTAGDVAVAAVSPPRIEEEPVVAEVAEGEAGAEPEMIGGEKKEGEEAAAETEKGKKEQTGGENKGKSAES